MHVEAFEVSPFAENCYVCHSAGEAVLIDPGTLAPEEEGRVEQYISENDLAVRYLLLTHGHLDHVFGCAHFAQAYPEAGGWHLHEEDEPLMARAKQQAQMYGVPMRQPPEPQHRLAHGDIIQFGEAEWEVRHAPGHSPGSVVFVDHAHRLVIGGDVLFQGSVGRTDLYKGSWPVLEGSIREQLLTLPDDYRLYPGHGPATTIGHERATNPFLNG